MADKDFAKLQKNYDPDVIFKLVFEDLPPEVKEALERGYRADILLRELQKLMKNRVVQKTKTRMTLANKYKSNRRNPNTATCYSAMPSSSLRPGRLFSGQSSLSIEEHAHW